MMKKISALFYAIMFCKLSFSQVILMQGNLKLTMQKESIEFADAALKLNQPTETNFNKADTIKFNFEVEGFVLGKQTADAETKRCANSAKGQHIHFILDNKPYEALYKPNYKTFLNNGPHILLAFLSRSYHESIKKPNAFILKQFNVGETNLPSYDLTQPMLFYSRPKGIYIGGDTDKVLLDFYIVNTTLSAKGNKVKATINGQTFMLTNWKPFLIEGLPMGESKIKLELVNKKGKPIKGAFTATERTIILAASEPIKN